MLEPQSTALFVLLVVIFGGLMWATIFTRRTAFRVLAACLAFMPAMLFGVLAVNKYYGYYQTWGAVMADFGSQGVNAATRLPDITLAADPGSGTLDGSRAHLQLAQQQGYTLRLKVTGPRSGITRVVYVYLPPQYFRPAFRAYRFPVIELLHGQPGKPEDWITVVGVTNTFDRLLAEKLARPAVVVMPDANGDRRISLQCLNQAGGPQDLTYLAEDLPAQIAHMLRVQRPGPAWGVAGYSEGGFCAANMALRYPHRYGFAAVLSGYFTPLDNQLAGPARLVSPFGGNRGLQEENTPLQEIQTLPAGLALPRFWLGAGGSDHQDVANAELFWRELRARQADVPLTLTPGGGHTMATWRAEVPSMLTWMTPGLAQVAQQLASGDHMTMNCAARCPHIMRPNVHNLCGHPTMATVWPGHNGEMEHGGDLVPRQAESLVTEALADTRVVTINGARQAGKSTLARIAAAGHPNTVVRLLDDPATLRAAEDDPAGFVEHDGLMVIDEVQLAPWLFRSIKVTVDTNPRPGQFLLTGSAQVLALRGLPDALPGRMEIVELWPFSQGELERFPDAFADAAFAHGPDLARTSALRKRDYLDRVVRGGYPEAIRRAPRRRAAFFDSYLTNLIERDVKELAAIERRGDLRRLLALLAGRSGGLLVPATLAAASGIPRTTLNRYLELLSAVFLIKQIPAWSGGQAQRAIGTPKLAFVDTGIASHLIGQDTARLGEPDGAAGPMIETFVLMELARQLTWCQERARLYHYRTKDKTEVDAVLETPDGRVVAIEVKAGATVRREDLAGLRHLAQRLGPRLVAGYVLYTGQQTLPFGDRLRALPIDALWNSGV